MKNKPVTRTEADVPKEVEHLSPEQHQALEAATESEHAIGTEREKLTRKAGNLGDEKTE